MNINYLASTKLANTKGDLYFFNFSPWRMSQVKDFFTATGRARHICNSLDDALSKGLNKESTIFIFGIVDFLELERYTKEIGISVYRIEDAFIRSVALGSGFAKPYSLSIDSRGIYYDPRRESDLEHILQNYQFDEELLARARHIREEIVSSRFSKYNHLEHRDIEIDRSRYSKVILVPGQVEDDMSILYGAYGLTNSDLLKMARESDPDAYIIYKPHPDVLSGNRKGSVPKHILQQCADEVQMLVSIDSCLSVCDEVHTLTSGVGFDGLLRGKRVCVYGVPFYSGWGLTEDYRTCSRRAKTRTLDELVAAALILYPVYISPKTGKFCEAEQTLSELKEEQDRYFNSYLYRNWIDLKGYMLPRARTSIRAILNLFGIRKNWL